jgi:DNA-binding beta-propeller fold protein YncE
MDSHRKLLWLLGLFLAGCATTWSLNTGLSDRALQWPYPPEKPKVSFLMSLEGFKREDSAQSLLRAVAFGSGSGDVRFGLPFAVAVGRDGRIAVADTGQNCVHLFIPGVKKYLRLSKAGNVHFISPVSVIFDDDQRLYVSDSMLGRIAVFGIDGAFLFSISSGDAGKLKRPTGLAFSPDNKLLYAIDTLANKVYAFNAEGKGVFSFGKRGEKDGDFNYPTNIFWGPDRRLYITDAMNFRVEIFDESGRFISAFGRHGDAAGDIAMPKGIAADKDGTIYLVDALFDNVQLFSGKGQFLLAVGAGGTGPGEFWLPSGIFLDRDAKLYVCDPYNHRIQVFQVAVHNDAGN